MNPANMEGEGIASTETDDLEGMSFRSQHVLWKASLVGVVPTPIPNGVQNELAKGLEGLGDPLVCEKSRVDEFVQMKEKLDRLLEEVNADKIEM